MAGSSPSSFLCDSRLELPILYRGPLAHKTFTSTHCLTQFSVKDSLVLAVYLACEGRLVYYPISLSPDLWRMTVESPEGGEFEGKGPS